ncbi:MAG: 50S ribosomal protein L22 [Patescibacteria group bacterium]
MEAVSIQKFIHTSPRKLRLVADMVRKMVPTRAQDILTITQRAAAKELLKVINTAVANAKQKGLDSEKIAFKKIEINEGPRMKRYRAGTRGRVRPYQRKMSHIKIVLADDLSEKLKVQSEKSEKRREEKK